MDSKSKGKKRAREDNSDVAETETIARYGKLLVKYYPLLESLPEAALPDAPPTGAHQYKVKVETSAVIINLRGFMSAVKGFASCRFKFTGKADISLTWARAREHAMAWHTNPPKHCAVPPPPPPIYLDETHDAQKEGVANAANGAGEDEDGNSDDSNTSSSHWGS